MFQLNNQEVTNLKCQIGISRSWGRRRHPPYAFTEQGVAMLSSVLRSKRAVAVNEAPILNSPYEYPARHWELDEHGQATQKIIENRRRAEFITPIPRPKKQKGKGKQAAVVFDSPALQT